MKKIVTSGDDPSIFEGESVIISITDIIEQKVKKEQELQNFERQLKELLDKKFWLEKDIQIHEFIISAVRNEITPQAFIQGLIKAEMKSKPDEKV